MAIGFTKVPHGVFELMMRRGLSKREYMVMLYIIRHGYGYNKAQSECVRNVGRMVEYTGLDRSHINTTLRQLVEKGIILIEQDKIRLILESGDGLEAKTASGKGRNSLVGVKAKTASEESRPKQPQKKAETATGYGQNSLEYSGNTLTDSDLPSPKENRKEKRNPHTPTNGGLSVDDLFNQIWALYPKKVGKALAKKAFQKIKPNKELFDTMIKAIETHSSSRDWTKENGQYIPHLSTWLNQERWEDELETTTAQTAFGFE